MCLSPIRTKKGYVVPCGKCVECLSQKRNDWSVRLYYEMQKYSTPPAFVTLTYDDDHLPSMVDEDTGELVPVVSKRDLQLFFKRLRKRVPGIRYFFCSEYGPTTGRPHYHGIIFNLPQKYFSLYLRCCTDDLNKLIFDCWKNGFTSAYLAKPAAIHYCTKYCLTDNVLKNSAYDDTSESEVQKRYNDFRDRYENVYKYGKSGRYTTNYYGVSHDPSKANTWDCEKNRPLRDSDFLFGSRSAFIIRMSLIILLILILLILWLSFMKKYMDNNYVHVPVVEKPAYQNDDLPLIDFNMAYEDVVVLLGDPDPIQYKGSNLYAYWGSSYIIFDKNFKVIGWLNNGAFHTDEYTGAASKHLRELYNSINSSYKY